MPPETRRHMRHQRTADPHQNWPACRRLRPYKVSLVVRSMNWLYYFVLINFIKNVFCNNSTSILLINPCSNESNFKLGCVLCSDPNAACDKDPDSSSIVCPFHYAGIITPELEWLTSDNSTFCNEFGSDYYHRLHNWYFLHWKQSSINPIRIRCMYNTLSNRTVATINV